MKVQFVHQRPGKIPVEHWENAKTQYNEIATFQCCKIKVQQKSEFNCIDLLC